MADQEGRGVGPGSPTEPRPQPGPAPSPTPDPAPSPAPSSRPAPAPSSALAASARPRPHPGPGPAPSSSPAPIPGQHPHPTPAPGAESGAAAAAAMWAALPLLCAGAWLLGSPVRGTAGLSVSVSGTGGAGDRGPRSRPPGLDRVGRVSSQAPAQGSGVGTPEGGVLHGQRSGGQRL